MTVRRGALLAYGYGVLCLGALALGLAAGTSGVFVVGALIAGTSAVMVSGISLDGLGALFTCGFVFMTGWNAVSLGPIRPADFCLVFAVVAFAVARLEDRRQLRLSPALPPWLLQLIAVIALVYFLTARLPFATDYLTHRPFLNSQAIISEPDTTNFLATGRWLVAAIFVPVVVGLAVQYRRDLLAVLAKLFAFGAAVSGFISLTDRYGITHVSTSLGTAVYGTRQSSLALHPNHLAASCIVAAPLALWMVVDGSPRARWWGLLCFTGNLTGVYESGSRGGAVVFVASVVVAALLIRSFRRRTVLLAAGLAAAVFLLLVLNPSLIRIAAKTTRLSGGSDTEGSDAARNALGSQAIEDLHQSPIYGLGLQVSATAHNIFLQVLASGGVLLFVSFVAFLLFGVLAGVRFGKVSSLGMACAASVLGWAILGLGENFLTDRYLYVTVSLAIAAVSTVEVPLRTLFRSDTDTGSSVSSPRTQGARVGASGAGIEDGTE